MEVNLSADLQGKLTRAAGRRGVSPEVVIREAIERAVDYDDWFIREVEKGLAQVDAGQVLTHDAVGSRLNQKVAERPANRDARSGAKSHSCREVAADKPR
jgi:predicted transcriptional regulator